MNEEIKQLTMVEEKKVAEGKAQLSEKALGDISGGIFRITNIRVNANGITGGGPIPANAVAA
jgi:hypothetical protein